MKWYLLGIVVMVHLHRLYIVLARKSMGSLLTLHLESLFWLILTCSCLVEAKYILLMRVIVSIGIMLLRNMFIAKSIQINLIAIDMLGAWWLMYIEHCYMEEYFCILETVGMQQASWGCCMKVYLWLILWRRRGGLHLLECREYWIFCLLIYIRSALLLWEVSSMLRICWLCIRSIRINCMVD